MKKTMILMLDTETANTIECPLAYNFGAAIIDLHGNVYKTFSYCIDEIYNGENDLMNTCYYAEKLPQYEEQIRKGEVKVAPLAEVVNEIRRACKEYGVTVWCAHNARFDNCSLNTTQRYVTKSRYRYFLPYELEAWDTMKMAQDTICQMPTFKKFCEVNGYLTKRGQVRKTAEVLYRFIKKDTEFNEEHKALEDVMIETEILNYCFRQHKKMRKKLWED